MVCQRLFTSIQGKDRKYILDRSLLHHRTHTHTYTVGLVQSEFPSHFLAFSLQDRHLFVLIGDWAESDIDKMATLHQMLLAHIWKKSGNTFAHIVLETFRYFCTYWKTLIFAIMTGFSCVAAVVVCIYFLDDMST